MFYLLRRKMGCERESIGTSTNDNDEAFAQDKVTAPI